MQDLVPIEEDDQVVVSQDQSIMETLEETQQVIDNKSEVLNQTTDIEAT